MEPDAGGARFFAFYSYSLAQLRAKFCVHACMTPVFSGRTKLLYFALAKWALGVPVFYATSWRFPRSSQEGNLDVPSKTSPPPAVLTMNGGDFAFASVLHLGRIYRTPKMGLLLAKAFAILLARRLPFGGRTKALPYHICANKGVSQGVKFVAIP